MNSSQTFPIITIDGPSGSGKGTVCWRLAETLGYQLLDSGALYRIVGLEAFKAGLLADSQIDEVAVSQLTESLSINFIANPETTQIDIIVNDEQVGSEIRNETVGGYASKIAIFPKVRTALLNLQRDMAQYSGVIADGRDMGTVVFPHADAKIYLTASAESRAQRRVAQLEQVGSSVDFEVILSEIKSRDERDENRTTSPSKPAEDALFIDSSELNAAEVYEIVKAHCMKCAIKF